MPLVTGFLCYLFLFFHPRHVVILSRPGCWPMTGIQQPSSMVYNQQCVWIQVVGELVVSCTQLQFHAGSRAAHHGFHCAPADCDGGAGLCRFLECKLIDSQCVCRCAVISSHGPGMVLARQLPHIYLPTMLPSIDALPHIPSGPFLIAIIPCLLSCLFVNLYHLHV